MNKFPRSILELWTMMSHETIALNIIWKQEMSFQNPWININHYLPKMMPLNLVFLFSSIFFAFWGELFSSNMICLKINKIIWQNGSIFYYKKKIFLACATTHNHFLASFLGIKIPCCPAHAYITFCLWAFQNDIKRALITSKLLYY